MAPYEVFCAVLYVLRTGSQWRLLPREWPKWQTVYSYFAKWNEPDQHGISVLEQALVTDRQAALQALKRCKASLTHVQSVLADAGYVGAPFAQGVGDILGEHVTVQIAKRSELHTFKVMSKRLIVERSFAWLEKNRRLWKSCERHLNTSLQFVHLAFLALLLRRS